METDQINTIPLTEKVVEKNPFTDLVDEFEKSLKSFVSLYNIEVPENRTNNEFGKKNTQNQIELNKKIIEQQTDDVYEKARNLERLFLNYRFNILKKDPEQFVKEEISCLKAELARKEELLGDCKRKVASYEQTLKAVGTQLDYQVKSRNEMSTQGYMPNEMPNQGFNPAQTLPPQPAMPLYQ